MTRGDPVPQRSVALYWDFENLHAGLSAARHGEGSYNKPDNRFKAQEPLVDIQAIVELGCSFGPIAINRAYCNWQFYGRYRDALLQNSIELIQLFPPGASAKNGADIKLCLDATEDVGRFAHIHTVVIIGGDSDFMAVAQKIKAAGRVLVGVGTRRNTNRHWARSCHEFHYYEGLVAAEPAAEKARDDSSPGVDPPVDLAAAMLERSLRLLSQSLGTSWVGKAAIWKMLKRLDPAFDPREHGYADFDAMLKALEAIVEVHSSEAEVELRLR